MFIHVTRDYAVVLKEPQDFKHFKLVVDTARADQARLSSALTGIATLSSEGHAWVSEDWLRRRDSAPAWQEGIDAMVAVARKYGWTDDKTKSVRAHVEWAGQTPAKS